MTTPVLYSTENGIALITLNRTERKNALNQSLLTGLYNAIDKVKDDKDIHAAIITGTGNAFSSGIDLGCLETDDLLNPRGDGRDMPDVFDSCKKIIIGAVNGYAITGGFELALNCDFLIASEAASFKDTHAQFGIHPGWGMSQLLQQAVGQRRAKQISLTGEKVSAKQAYEYGLVNEVVSPDKLIPRAFEIAAAIASANIPMMYTVKALIESRNRMNFDDAMKTERTGFDAFAGTMFKK